MSTVSVLVYHNLSAWKKLRILIGKGFHVQTSQHLNILAIFFVPILIFLYSQLNHIFRDKSPTVISETKYPPLDLEVPKVTEIFYSPTNPVLETVVSEVAMSLDTVNTKAYQHASDMEHALIEEDGFVGIQFEDHFRNIIQIPEKVKVALRFPIHLRTQDNAVWPNRLFRKINDEVGWKSDPYLDEGFLIIQIKLSEALLRARNQTVQIPPVYLQPFPDSPHSLYSNLIEPFQHLITVFPFLFIVSSVFISEKIIQEKQRQSREIIRLMGLSAGLNWVSWFIVTFVLVSLPMLLVGILMKIMLCPSSSLFVLLLICLTYVFTLSSFICLVTVFIANSFLAIVSICIFHIMSFLPYYLMVDILTGANLAAVSLFCNSAMPFVLTQVLGFELLGEGINLSNLFLHPHPEDPLSCGSILLLMWLAGILRLVFCVYVDQLFPTQFGVQRKWYYPIRRSYWCPWESPWIDIINAKKELLEEGKQNFLAYEEEMDDKDAVVVLKHLTMVVDGEAVVEDFSLKLYDNEITVLMGSNGSGKSTIFMMIAGMYAPTEGTILINGHNMGTEYAVKYARTSIGICPQQDILLEELSPYRHIVFFSEMKGYSRANADTEAKKYLEKINLLDKAHIRVAFLPHSMRRKLALCCALCADTKVVLLDMPTSEMDSTSRQEIWDLLLSEKVGRCIFISTIYTSAAEIVADRVAIISEGKLIAHGSRDFLLKSVGVGYKLVCKVQEDCNVDNLTLYLNKYDVKWDSIEDNTVIYRIPKENENKLTQIARDLEKKEEKFKLKSFEIMVPTLMEIIWKLSTNVLNQGSMIERISSAAGWMKLTNGPSKTSRFRRFVNICHALFISKRCHTFNYLNLILYVLALPIGLSLVMILMKYVEEASTLNPYNLKLYPKPIVVTVWPRQHGDWREYGIRETAYIYNRVASIDGAIVKTSSINMETYLLKNVELQKSLSYVAACTFHTTTITAWFNRHLYHGSPLSVNLVYKALASSLASMELDVVNMPRPDSDPGAFKSAAGGLFKSATLITLYLCIVMACFSAYIIQERVNQMRHLYFTADIHNATYYLLNLLFDYIIYLVVIIVILISLLLISFISQNPRTGQTIFFMTLLLLVFGFSALAFIYLLSFVFKDANTGLSWIVFINFFVAIIAFYVLPVSKQKYFSILHSILKFLPYYALYSACVSIMRSSNISGYWDSTSIGSGCCVFSPPEADPPVHIWNEIIYLIASGVFCLILILLSTYLHHLRTLYKKADKDCVIENEDVDVQAERNSVNEIAKNLDKLKECDLLLQDVTKKKRENFILKCISFKIMPNECFGLLGQTGAGKTTTLNMIMGSQEVTQGNIYSKGYNIRKNQRNFGQNIGFMINQNAFRTDMTARDMLKVTCLIRGIDKEDIPNVTIQLAESFGFIKYLDKKTLHYSPGNKRKLNLAMAVIASTLICLDEPTSDIDICARKEIWTLLTQLRNLGKSLLITSSSSLECEELCSTVAVLVRGMLYCIGPLEHLKARFKLGITIYFQMATESELLTMIRAYQNERNDSTEESDDSTSKGKKKNVTTTDSVISVEITPLKSTRKNDPTRITIQSRASIASHRATIRIDQRRVSESSYYSGYSVARDTYTASNANFFMAKAANLEEQMKIDFPSLYVIEIHINSGLTTVRIPDPDLKWSKIFNYIEKNRISLGVKDYVIDKSTLDDILNDFSKGKTN